mmetsp:Transcript_7807/g.17142  ORF Transcript_7807/g.17142 Transcript_7807/m.17142 type:complete len:612 (-) Transcript_7807:67-1902(-)
MSAGVCPKGHILHQKVTTGGVLGTSKKSCHSCGNLIRVREMQYNCRECWRHYCHPCYEAGLTGVEPPPKPFGSTPLIKHPGGAHRRSPSAPLPKRAATTGSISQGGTSALIPCRWGAACYNWDPEHRKKFGHPEPEDGDAIVKRRACRHGKGCFRIDQQHRIQFAHPGDRHYRSGLVEFEGDLKPELDSLREIFQFYDPDESGHLSKEEFQEAMRACLRLAPERDAPVSLREQWTKAGGPVTGYLNFRQFVAWTLSISLALPLGLDDSKASKPCRFRIMNRNGACCQCEAYEPSADGFLCICGHKPSCHRSDVAELSATDYLARSATKGLTQAWDDGKEGLVEVSDPTLLANFQKLFDTTHKLEDNWTRDRGCKLHGVNGPGCSAACASRNRVAVPSQYTVVRAFRNQNIDLWKKYSLHLEEVAEECSGTHNPDATGASRWKPVDVLSGKTELEQPLHKDCNEWLLFHGSSLEKCKGICSSNFRLAMAGTGATWKEPGKPTGQPLYGYGVYFAERITKADEYSLPAPKGEEDAGLYAVLLCRVLGGRVNVVESNEIEVEKLRKSVFDGPCHSVLGDRIKTLNKPYREVVVYDKDQIYPEYLLLYRRGYGPK